VLASPWSIFDWMRVIWSGSGLNSSARRHW
jgi:hypothetical protein